MCSCVWSIKSSLEEILPYYWNYHVKTLLESPEISQEDGRKALEKLVELAQYISGMDL